MKRNRISTRSFRPLRDKQPLRSSLADALLAGQRLRADETATALTFRIGYAAKWAQVSKAVSR